MVHGFFRFGNVISLLEDPPVVPGVVAFDLVGGRGKAEQKARGKFASCGPIRRRLDKLRSTGRISDSACRNNAGPDTQRIDASLERLIDLRPGTAASFEDGRRSNVHMTKERERAPHRSRDHEGRRWGDRVGAAVDLELKVMRHATSRAGQALKDGIDRSVTLG